MTDVKREVLVTTTDAVQGRSVVRYLGPVFGEHVHSLGWLRNLADDVRHALDTRSQEFHSEMLEGRVDAVRELRRQAEDLRADAVIGTTMAVEVLRGGVVVTLAQGTAVQLDRPVSGGWVVPPQGAGAHPIVEDLQSVGPATLAELSSRIDADVDWVEATLATLEDSGHVVMDDEGRWHPASLG